MDSSEGPRQRQSPAFQQGLGSSLEAAALPSMPAAGLAHLQPPTDTRPWGGQGCTCCTGQGFWWLKGARLLLRLALAGTRQPCQDTSPPGSSQLPQNRLEKPNLEKTPGAQRPPGPAELACCRSGCYDGGDQGWQGLPLPAWHHHRRNRAPSHRLLFLCKPGYDPLCTAEKTRKTERKPGSAQRKNWGRDTLSSNWPASRPEETMLGTERRAMGPCEGLNPLPVHAAGGSEAPGAAWAGGRCQHSSAVGGIHLPAALSSAHVYASCPSPPFAATPQPSASFPMVPDPSSHKEASNFWGRRGNARGDSGADTLQVCFSTT